MKLNNLMANINRPNVYKILPKFNPSKRSDFSTERIILFFKDTLINFTLTNKTRHLMKGNFFLSLKHYMKHNK